MGNLREISSIEFERTVWAEKRLANLCPGKDIKKLQEALSDDDTEKQFNLMEDMIIIMHDAFDRKAKFLNPEHIPTPLTKEELDLYTEQELTDLVSLAFASFDADGEVTVEAEPKKNEGKATKST